jgi:hypothetical protein
MRVGTSIPLNWVALRMAQQTFVQAASHASQPTAKPVTEPDRVKRSPAPRPLTAGRLDIRA